jgi:hypothetical protein
MSRAEGQSQTMPNAPRPAVAPNPMVSGDRKQYRNCRISPPATVPLVETMTGFEWAADNRRLIRPLSRRENCEHS